jgi:hypothetical protein
MFKVDSKSGVDSEHGMIHMSAASTEAESMAAIGSLSTACRHVSNDHINFYQSPDESLIIETNNGMKGCHCQL